MNNYIQDGHRISVTLAAAKSAGAIEDFGNIVGVYAETGVTGDVVPVVLDGVFQLTKKAGASEALSVGEKVYLSAAGAITVSSATGTNNPAGVAVETAATGATTCKVRLNFGGLA